MTEAEALEKLGEESVCHEIVDAAVAHFRARDVPTEKEFRDAGHTANAINFPLSEAGFARLCAYNGTTPDKAPRAWRYAPNAYVRAYWEQSAAANSGRSPSETPPIAQSGSDAHRRISGGVGTAPQQHKSGDCP